MLIIYAFLFLFFEMSLYSQERKKNIYMLSRKKRFLFLFYFKISREKREFKDFICVLPPFGQNWKQQHLWGFHSLTNSHPNKGDPSFSLHFLFPGYPLSSLNHPNSSLLRRRERERERERENKIRPCRLGFT
jgi:hypothetical protein